VTNSKQIHLIEEYAKHRITVPKKEFEELKDSIKTDGQHYPIAINPDGGVLDGHHRLQACIDLGIDVAYEVKEFPNKLLEEKFVIVSNIRRRQITDEQRLIAQEALMQIQTKLAAQRMIEGASKGGKSRVAHKNATLNDQKPKKKKGRGNRAEEIAARQVGWSATSYRQAKFILNNGNEQEKKLFREGKKKKTAVVKIIKKRLAKENILREAKKYPEVDQGSYSLINDDFRISGYKIKDKIDLIFTDPPYGEKDLNLFSGLAELARRRLEEGGSLVTYCGNWAVLEIGDIMRATGLTYHWQLAVALEGGFARHYQKKVVIKWKPLLWFSKGKPNHIDFIADLIDSTKVTKELHPWEQSVEEARHVISRLTEVGQTVLDPMMGTGTTIIAAQSLNRKAIGIEIDKETYQFASANIKKSLAIIAGVVVN